MENVVNSFVLNEEIQAIYLQSNLFYNSKRFYKLGNQFSAGGFEL